MDGRSNGLNSRTLQFVPTRPFELGTVYKLTLSPGNLTSTGRVLKNGQSWEFQVRDPLVAYLLTDDNQSSIWAMDLKDNPARRITPETIKVISFDTSFNGEFIIFTSANEQSGIDLWRVSRAGKDASILLDCGRDRCTTPIISPDGTRIAYSREAAGSAPIFHLVLRASGYWICKADRTALSMQTSKFWDMALHGRLIQQNLHPTMALQNRSVCLILKDNQQYIFPSNTGGPITWSPDSTKLLFTDIEQKEDGLRTRVRIADLSLNDSSTLIGAKDERDYSYHSLAWSPVEDSVVLGFRGGDDDPAQIFWLFDPGFLDGIIIADQPDYTYNSPRWDPWGTA